MKFNGFYGQKLKVLLLEYYPIWSTFYEVINTQSVFSKKSTGSGRHLGFNCENNKDIRLLKLRKCNMILVNSNVCAVKI